MYQHLEGLSWTFFYQVNHISRQLLQIILSNIFEAEKIIEKNK